MDNLGYYCLLALLSLLYLIKSYLTPAYRGHRLPPGPWQLPIIGSLHHLRGGVLHHVMTELSKIYGPIMFLKMGEIPVVFLSSREAAREVLKTHDAVFATRPQTPTVKLLNNECPGFVFAPYGEQWRQFRKICMVELLSARRVQSFGPVREDEALRLVRSVSSSPTPLVNLSELLSAYVLDTSVRCIMGDRFEERDVFLRELEKDMKLMGGFSLTDIFPSSWLVRKLSSTARVVEAHQKEVLKLMDAVLKDHMERRSNATPCHEDFIDVLVRIQREEGNLATKAIKGLVHDLFTAGGETAAVTLQWAMSELMRNPAVMKKAQDEVRGAFSRKMKVTEEGLVELNYLRCVVKETLRRHPAGAFLLPRECREKCRVLGYDVPKGAIVMVNIWAISNNEEYWDEPATFRPERFEGGMIDFRGNDFEFTPFGAGRRICPGISFGLANVDMALANLLFYFNWSLPDGLSCTDLDMTEEVGLTIRRKSPLYLKATPYKRKLHSFFSATRPAATPPACICSVPRRAAAPPTPASALALRCSSFAPRSPFVALPPRTRLARPPCLVAHPWPPPRPWPACLRLDPHHRARRWRPQPLRISGAQRSRAQRVPPPPPLRSLPCLSLSCLLRSAPAVVLPWRAGSNGGASSRAREQGSSSAANRSSKMSRSGRRNVRWWDEEDDSDVDDLLIIAGLQEGYRRSKRKKKFRGSLLGRHNLPRDTLGGHNRIYLDYFADQPVYPEKHFRRRFRMSKSIFLRIVMAVEAHDDYFRQKPNAIGALGVSAIQKVVATKIKCMIRYSNDKIRYSK